MSTRVWSETDAALCDVNFDAAGYYRDQLKQSRRAQEYLQQERGISGVAAQRFALGWAPPGWRALSSAFRDYEHNALLEQTGLVIARDGRRYDRFRERIMFPITTADGAIIAFGGRVVRGDQPKYLNSPESAVFQKGSVLYGMAQAGEAISSTGELVVVEGYMDVVSMWQAGIRNACAALGTATTEANASAALNVAPRVLFAFDGDAAGEAAAEKAIARVLPAMTAAHQVRVLTLPNGHDPDSFVRAAGAEARSQWRLASEGAPSMFAFLQRLQERRCPGDYPEARATRGYRLTQYLVDVTNESVREQWLRQAAEANQVSVDALTEALHQMLSERGAARSLRHGRC